MDRIPFGISRLDDIIGGGAPAGSVVLVASESGAGGREFLYTSALVNGLALGGRDEVYDLHYGDVDARVGDPESVHYVSLTAAGEQVRREMGLTMDDDLVAAGADAVEFADLSPEYFQLSPVPREWYAEETRSIEALGERRERGTALDGLGDYLEEHAEGSLVVLDSVTDIVGLVRGSTDLDWSDLTLLMQGLKKASYRWGGLVLMLVNTDTLTDEELGILMDASDGTLLLEWAAGGSELARTLVVKQFRGVLSRLEAENIVRFETDIGEAGLDISDVRKIR
jgi:KaiC/GvpD/RAD55 family RecA-like ATPase